MNKENGIDYILSHKYLMSSLILALDMGLSYDMNNVEEEIENETLLAKLKMKLERAIKDKDPSFRALENIENLEAISKFLKNQLQNCNLNIKNYNNALAYILQIEIEGIFDEIVDSPKYSCDE